MLSEREARQRLRREQHFAEHFKCRVFVATLAVCFVIAGLITLAG